MVGLVLQDQNVEYIYHEIRNRDGENLDDDDDLLLFL